MKMCFMLYKHSGESYFIGSLEHPCLSVFVILCPFYKSGHFERLHILTLGLIYVSHIPLKATDISEL